jgi:heterotetrameric sarcosine oxidase gamma subunit
VARLIAKTPADGLLPVDHGGCRLTEHLPEAIISVAPFRGREADVARALGQPFPKPGATTTGPAGHLIWSGRGQALLLGPPVAALDGAALTDQSDAWAVLDLDGPAAEAVLARLVPADLRPRSLPDGATLRTLLGHMNVSITRMGGGFRLLVFRSMARTAVHELTRAMESVAAQGG